jgi:hypothetical protein
MAVVLWHHNFIDSSKAKVSTATCLIILHEELIHRQHGKRMVVGSNLTLTIIQVSCVAMVLLSGSTIRTFSLETIREAKKMLSLMDEAVKSKILKKVDGEYEFDSGKGMSDFIDFIFYQMFNWQYYNGATTATVDVEEGCAAEDGGTTEEGDDEEVDAATDGEDGHTAANSNEGNAG